MYASKCIHASIGAEGQYGGVVPTAWQREVAAKSNQVKVFTYDLAGQGFQPPLSDFAVDGPACRCPPLEHVLRVTPPGLPQDLCAFHRLRQCSAF